LSDTTKRLELIEAQIKFLFNTQPFKYQGKPMQGRLPTDEQLDIVQNHARKHGHANAGPETPAPVGDYVPYPHESVMQGGPTLGIHADYVARKTREAKDRHANRKVL